MYLSISSIETVKKGREHSAREISAYWCVMARETHHSRSGSVMLERSKDKADEV
jgi:hypothetical protein